MKILIYLNWSQDHLVDSKSVYSTSNINFNENKTINSVMNNIICKHVLNWCKILDSTKYTVQSSIIFFDFKR